jgi:Ni/Co efflux regulator RcnB
MENMKCFISAIIAAAMLTAAANQAAASDFGRGSGPQLHWAGHGDWDRSHGDRHHGDRDRGHGDRHHGDRHHGDHHYGSYGHHYDHRPPLHYSYSSWRPHYGYRSFPGYSFHDDGGQSHGRIYYGGPRVGFSFGW